MRNLIAPRFAALCVALAVVFTGCAHTSRITTHPEGAQVYVDNVPLPQGDAVLFHSRSGLPKSYFVKIEKPGYQSIQNVVIERQYRADLSLLLLIPGILPYFFSARLEDSYEFTLLPEKEGS